ncbi:serine-threonine-isoleucine rich protein putative [Entamoeba histolytica]|uniref:Serine-threonine-isoleucine rich protein, putative n=3 Tax=Entamoeba histolytica TaxID=5759 RepID=C4LXM3_ENTH1|nr:serine-threonine-isoleucine rich protein, putative [Entamoeba histolytica HM-1:IMSS]EAL48575.1 serine-threonine-isoleucine rich protein, putative [Entamoeba histolytica HM-1:IMSS]ENY61848.1 serine-threonine-isoleucine rich protein, putative [Entamoeba histolytica HM-1:IMSS-A]GAT93510.1 serine-threonine-isoleucine rich protein putative [Entamoeba histolytica]|eukprot:XP_653961.1 serine-threonine-isoleucine rich protein, putative [Entamoeba histolytica HM-1:IMSS]
MVFYLIVQLLLINYVLAYTCTTATEENKCTCTCTVEKVDSLKADDESTFSCLFNDDKCNSFEAVLQVANSATISDLNIKGGYQTSSEGSSTTTPSTLTQITIQQLESSEKGTITNPAFTLNASPIDSSIPIYISSGFGYVKVIGSDGLALENIADNTLLVSGTQIKVKGLSEGSRTVALSENIIDFGSNNLQQGTVELNEPLNTYKNRYVNGFSGDECTFGSNGFSQEECKYLNLYNNMVLRVTSDSYPTDLNTYIVNEWKEIKFETENDLIIPESITIKSNTLSIGGKFTINCPVTVTTLNIIANPENKITKSITVSEIVAVDQKTVYFVLTNSAVITKKEETESQSENPFVVYKLSETSSRVVSSSNEEGEKCVYEKSAYTSSDCNMLDDNNEVILKFIPGESEPENELSYDDKFKTNKFKGIDLTSATNVNTIKGFKLTSFTLTKTGLHFINCEITNLIYQSGVTIDYLLFTENSKVNKVIDGQPNYLFTANSQTMLSGMQDSRLHIDKVTKDYYRYSFSSNGAVCTLTCSEKDTKCKFVEFDCTNSKLVEPSLMTLKFKEQTFTLYPIECSEGMKYDFKECDGSNAVKIQGSDTMTQTITCPSFKADHITIETDKMVITKFEVTGTALSILKSVPSTIEFKSSLTYIIVNSAYSSSDKTKNNCIDIADEYMRCGSSTKPDNNCVVTSLAQNTYEQEDCSSSYIDLKRMDLVFNKDPSITSGLEDSEKEFKSLTVKCVDCSSFTLNIPKFTFDEEFDISNLNNIFFTIKTKVSGSAGIILPTQINGYLILDGANPEKVTLSITGSLYTNINGLKCFSNGESSLEVESSYYWYDKTHVCVYESASFRSEICKIFSSYENVNVQINAPTTISTPLSVNTLTFSDGASTTQPNIKCKSVVVSKDTTLSEVFNTLTMNGNDNGITVTISESVGKAIFNGDNIKLNAKTITSYELINSPKGIQIFGSLSEQAAVQEGTFYGNLEKHPNTLKKVQMGDNFYRYSNIEINDQCTYTNSKFNEYDCQKYLDQFNTEKYVTIEYKSSGTNANTFKKCIVSISQQISSMKCKETELKVDSFSITDSQLGSVTMNSQYSQNKIISTSTITSISLSDTQTSNLPIFYGHENTIEGTTLYYFKISENNGRYYFKEEGAITTCEYSNGEFNIGDCSSVDSLDLIIKSDGFSSNERKYNTVTVESNVQSIISIIATTLTLKCSTVTIDSITVDKLQLPDTYSDYYFKSGTITNIVGGLSPLFIGGSENIYSVTPFVENDNTYRYFRESKNNGECTCTDNNEFEEWDCKTSSKYYAPEKMKLVCEQTFVFDSSNTKKFKEFSLGTEDIELTNLKVNTVNVNVAKYKLTNVDIGILTINKEFNGGLVSGNIQTITTNSDYSSNIIMYYSSESVPSFDNYYCHKIGDKIYRVSKEEKFYCTLKSDIDSVSFEEKDCNEEYTSTNGNKILKLTYNPSALTFVSPYNKFENIESSLNELVLNGITLNIFTSSESITKITLSLTGINTFNVGKLSNYKITVTDKIEKMIISTIPQDAYIKGTVNAIETSLSENNILFVLEGTPATDSSVSNYNSVKISENLYRITHGSNTKCTYNPSSELPFVEFDCNKYATNMESPLLTFMYSGSEDISLTTEKLNTFSSAILGSSSKIENLKITDKASFSTAISSLELNKCNFGTLEIVQVGKFVFTDSTIGTLSFLKSESHEGSELTRSTINKVENIVENSILCVGDELSEIKTGFSTYAISALKKRFSLTAENKYCTLTSAGYEEWDCTENYAENNYLFLKLTTTATLPTFPTAFKGVEFSSTSAVQITNSEPITFEQYSIESSNPIVSFIGTVTISSLSVKTDTPGFSYFESLTINNVVLEKSPNYILTTGNTVSIPNTIYSLSSSETTNRISSKSTLECTYVSDCSFTEADCNGYNNYVLSSLKANIVFNNENDNAIAYSCTSKEWNSISYNTEKSLSLTGQPFSVNTITFYPQVNIEQQITILQSCDFRNKETNNRQLSLKFVDGVSFTVFDIDNNKVDPVNSNENIPPKNYLFEGKLDGVNPANMYLIGCGESIYYYKDKKSDCLCTLKGDILKLEESSWTGANAFECYKRSDKVTSYSLAFSKESTGQIKVMVSDISFASIVFGDLQKVSFINGFEENENKENIKLTIDSITPCQHLSFDSKISVVVNNVGSNEAGFIFAEHIKVNGLAKSIIITKSSEAISGLTRTPFVDESLNGFARYHTKEDRGLNCYPGDTADCIVSEYSLYYTYQAGKETQITLVSSFKEIVSDLGTSDDTLTISRGDGIKDDVELTTFTAKCKTTIQGIKISTFIPSNKYVLLDNHPENIQDNSKSNYYYSSLSSAKPSGSANIVQCGDYYRVTKEDVQCKCYYDNLLPDCEINPNDFDYILKPKSQSSDTTYKIEKLWKTVSFDDAQEGDIVEIASKNNVIIIPQKSIKITGSSMTVSLDYNKLNDIPFIEINGVTVTSVINTENAGSQVLFGSDTSPDSSVSFATCSLTYFRGFADSKHKSCSCAVDESNNYDKNDCILRSSSLDLDIEIESHTVQYPWNVINILKTSTLTLSKDKTVNTINQKDGFELILNGDLSTSVLLNPSCKDYLYVDLNDGSANIRIEKSCVYYLNAKSDSYLDNALRPYVVKCGESNYRVGTDIECKCKLTTSGSIELNKENIDYVDCRHYFPDLSDYYFDLGDKNVMVNEDVKLKGFSGIVNDDFSIGGDGSLTLSSLELSKNKLTFTGKSVEIASANIAANEKLIDKTTEKMTINSLTVGTSNGPYILSYGAKDKALTISGEIETSVKNSIIDVLYANHVGVTIPKQDKLKSISLNGRTTVYLGVDQTPGDTVNCYITSFNSNYDLQFSTINCPCDTEKCIINVQSTSVNLGGSDSTAQWVIQQEMVSFTNPKSIAQMTVNSQSKTTITTESPLTIKNLNVDNTIVLSGSFNIESLDAQKVEVARESNVQIDNAKFSSFVSKTSNAVTVDVQSTTENTFELDCLNCQLSTKSSDNSAKQTIKKLVMGNSRYYKFTENAIFTISQISLDSEGSFELLKIDNGATLTFDSSIEQQTFTYPLLIADSFINENIIVNEANSNKFKKLCKSSKLFVYNSESIESISANSLSELCHFNGQKTVFTEDNAENCKDIPLCILELEQNPSESLKANYDRVICKKDLEFETDNDVTVECDDTHTITIVNPNPTEVRVNSIRCNLHLSSGPFIINSLSGSDNIEIIAEESTVSVTVKSVKCGSISTSSSLTIDGDVICSSIKASSLKLSSGSLSCSNNIISTQLEIDQHFNGLLKVSLLSAQSLIDGNKEFLNHAITSLGGELIYKDYYIAVKDANNAESSKKCYTVGDVLDISELRYSNNKEHNCDSDTGIVVSVESKEIIVSKEVKIDREITSGISNVLFTGTGSLTLTHYKISYASFYVKSDITASEGCSALVCASGVYNGFDDLTIKTVENVVINYAKRIFIEDVGTLTINGKSDGEIEISINSNKFSGSSRPVILVNSDDDNKFKVSYNEICKGSFTVIKSSRPLNIASNNENDVLLCNNKVLYHKFDKLENVPHISCDDELVEYDSQLNADPYECKNTNGLNCVATYTGSATNLENINAQTLIIKNKNSDENKNYIISEKVENLIIEGDGKADFTILPSTITVNGNVEVTFTHSSSDLSIPHYITGSEGSDITINCETKSGLHISSIHSDGSVSFNQCSGSSLIDGVVKVNKMALSASKFSLYSDFEVVGSLSATPILEENADYTVFTLNSASNKFIVNSVDQVGTCTILLNTRNLVVEPVVSIPEFISSNRIYYKNCDANPTALAFDMCTLRSDITSIDTLNIQESAYYQYYSICPDPTKGIDLSTVTINKLNGLEAVNYYSIKLGSNVAVQSSTSSPVVINSLNFSDSVTLESKYEINKLICLSGECSLVVAADTVITSSLEGVKSFNITIEPNAVFTYRGTNELNISTLTIKSANGLSFSALSASISFEAIVFTPITSSSSSYVFVKTLNGLESISVVKRDGVVLAESSKYPIVTSSDEITVTITENEKDGKGRKTVACNSKTVLYLNQTQQNEDSSKFVCPEVITCTMSSPSSTCVRGKDDSQEYVQQYKYVYTSGYDVTSINLPNNNKLTPSYDIVEIKGNHSKSIKIENGGSYLLDIASSCSGGSVSCISSDDSSASLSCTVRLSLNDGTISVNGKGIVIEEDSTYESASNSVINIPKDAVVDISSIVGTTIKLNLQEKGTVNIMKYGSFSEILMSDGSVINAYDAFDSSVINYNGGEIIVQGDNIVTLKEINILEGSISNGECRTIIRPSNFDDVTNPKKIWEGNVPFSNIVGIKYYKYSGSVLEACVSSSSEHKFGDVYCSSSYANSSICYCSYDPYVDQSCILSCEETESKECVFHDENSNSPLFDKVQLQQGQNKLKIESSMKLFKLDGIELQEIEAVVPITIYSIEDSDEKECVLTISGSNTLLSIERIHLVNPKSVLTLYVREVSIRELYIENANFETSAVITLLESNTPIISFSDAYDTGAISLPTVERQIVMKNASITFKNQGAIAIYGPSKDETFIDPETNSHYNADFNPTVIEDTQIHLVSDTNKCYENNSTKTKSVIYFDVVGRISVSNIEVDYNCLSNESSENSVANLIYTNIPNYITVSGTLSSNLRVDEQKYIIVVAAQDFDDIEQYNIPELSCVVSDTFRSNSFSETASDVWSSPTCPCTGNGCIIDTTKPSVAIRYNLDSKQLDKYSAKYGTMIGSDVTIQTLVVQGSEEHDNYAVTCSLTRSKITELQLENYGKITFDESQNINNIIGDNNTNTSVILRNSITLKTNEIRNTNLNLVGSSIYLARSSVGDFSGQTIRISSNGHFDLYSNNVEFTKDTIFNISFNSPGQSHSISVDDDVSGNSLSILNAQFLVNIPSGHSKCTFAFLRINQPVDNVDVTLVSPLSKIKGDSSSFKVYSLCGGLVISDLPEDQVSCPNDRMARSIETKEFPMYMIAVIVVFVLVLVVVAVVFIVYIIHVYIVRKRNLKVFEEGEEVDIEDDKKEEEIENKPNDKKEEEIENKSTEAKDVQNKDTTA